MKYLNNLSDRLGSGVLPLILCAVALAGTLMFSSCKKEAQFKIDGTVEGGADKTLALEKADFHGYWYPVDSVKVNADGKFSVKAEAPSSPEIYRLVLDGRYIYLPIDSIETLTVTAQAADFGSKFSVEGTEQASNMAQFETELMALDMNNAQAVNDFKRATYTKYLQNAEGSILSYYVLTKTIGNKPLYDPEDSDDAKYYAAVATAFEQFRPTDPHAKMLRDVSIQAMKNRNNKLGKRRLIEADETQIIELELPDENGAMQKLSSVVSQGKPTLLVVSMMNQAESPAFNMALSELYNRRGGNINIYHVSLDADRYAWREAARNLPWVTVYDESGRESGVLTKYNIGSLPAVFVYDSTGNLAHRAESLKDAESKLR